MNQGKIVTVLLIELAYTEVKFAGKNALKYAKNKIICTYFMIHDMHLNIWPLLWGLVLSPLCG